MQPGGVLLHGGRARDAPGRGGRVAWTPELEERFLGAVRRLGGLESATPKNIRQEMSTDLSLGHLKSHLQKLRREAGAPLKYRRTSGEEIRTAAREADDRAVAASRALSEQLDRELDCLEALATGWAAAPPPRAG